MNGALVAVLTGDLIRSRRLSLAERESVFEALKAVGRNLLHHFDAPVIGPHLFRGDSWQLMIGNARFALHAAFYLRAELISRFAVDSRIGIGIGCIDTLPAEGLGTADGSAFRLSGAALDSLSRRETCRCLLQEDPFFHSAWINVTLNYAARYASHWSQREAFAVARALEGIGVKQIAAEWLGKPATPANVSATLRRAAWEELRQFLNQFSAAIERISSKESA